MAVHDVKFVVPERPLGNVDIEFEVKKDTKKAGTLKVSKGGVEWLPKDHTYGYHLSWQQVDQLAREYGKRK